MKKENAPTDLLVFDTETTDKFPKLARIATCYAALIGRDGTVKRDWSWTLNPGVPMPEEASAVNGLTTAFLQENGRSDLLTAITEIYRVLLVATKKSIPIVAYNLPYDLTVLDREMRRQKLALGVTKLISGFPAAAPATFFDPLIWARHEFKYQKGGHKQFVTAGRLGIEVDESRLHDAKYDVELAGKIAWRMLQRHTTGFDDMRAIATELEIRHQDWAKGLTTYFASQGKVEEDGSPVVVEAAFPYYEPTEDEPEFYKQFRSYK